MGNSKKDDKKRRGGVYLAVIDTTEELSSAVDYACRFAMAEDGYVALLNIIESPYVAGWRDVEERVRKEARAQAEEMIWSTAARVFDQTGKRPIICIEEGDRSDTIIKAITDNTDIVALVLAPAASSSNPGPLVTYFSGKGLSRLPVPLMIAPVNPSGL